MQNKVVTEMLEDRKPFLPLNLQFFAEGGSDDNEGGDDDGADDDDEGGEENDDNSDDSAEEKKFTQADMTATATREKKQGRKAAIKELGFKSEKEAKEEMAEYRKWKESQLTPEQKQQKQLEDKEAEKSEAEKRAQAAEEKLAVVVAGVRKDSIDDVLAIARVKVTEEKTLDDVLEEMKKEDRYKSFFDGGEEDPIDGTGGSMKHKKNKSGTENIGARLAKQNIGNKPAKSSYF